MEMAGVVLAGWYFVATFGGGYSVAQVGPFPTQQACEQALAGTGALATTRVPCWEVRPPSCMSNTADAFRIMPPMYEVPQ